MVVVLSVFLQNHRKRGYPQKTAHPPAEDSAGPRARQALLAQRDVLIEASEHLAAEETHRGGLKGNHVETNRLGDANPARYRKKICWAQSKEPPSHYQAMNSSQGRQ